MTVTKKHRVMWCVDCNAHTTHSLGLFWDCVNYKHHGTPR